MNADFLNDETMAMLFAAVAAFSGVAILAMPDNPKSKLKARLRSVGRERDRLRERRVSELTLRSKQKVRKERSSLISRLATHFRDEDRSADGDLAVRLRMAGFRSQNAESIFLFFRALSPLVFSFSMFVLFALASRSGATSATAMTLCVAAAAIGYTLPRLVLDRLIAKRQRTILRAFPDALDLLLICVQSGMSVEAALGRVTKDISPQCIELAEELSLTMAELSYLPVRWKAYSNLSARIGLPAVKLITAALVQAERYGTSIGQALAAAAREGREARMTEAERQAAMLPPKLAVPLVVFFLPVLLTIILAPALMKANDAVRHSGRIVMTDPLAARPQK